MTDDDPARRRRALLEELYGSSADTIDAQLRVLIESSVVPGAPPSRPLTEADTWLISYADQFREGDEAPLQTLRRVVDDRFSPWINGVHVLPFHPWSSDEGFSVLDYAEVDPDYGNWADLEALSGEVRLMADAVINHLSARGPWFQEFLEGHPERSGFFRTVAPGTDMSAVVRPRPSSPITTFPTSNRGPVDVWTTFSPDQVDLDYGNPAVLIAVTEAVLRYVAAGAQAIRLDAVAYVGKQEGTPCIHLRQTHLIVQLLRACVDSVDPGVLLVTETNVPHAENVSYFGGADEREAQAVYQFSLPPLVLHAITTGDAQPLREWARAVDFGAPGRTFLNFLASHDGVGVRPAEGLLDPDAIDRLGATCQAAGGVVNEYAKAGGQTAPYELACTWYDLMAAGEDGSSAMARHLASHAVALGVRGVPLLYAQSMFATSNDYERYRASGVGRDLNRHRFEPATRMVARFDDPLSRPARAWDGLRAMLEWRRSSPAFHPDSPQRILDTVGGVFVVERGDEVRGRALVAVNFGRSAQSFDLPDGQWGRFVTGRTPEVDATGQVVLEPYEWLWLQEGAVRNRRRV